MLEMLFCLLSCAASGGLGALGEGAQIQLTSADLSTILATATIAEGSLTLEAELEPLSNVILIISELPEARAAIQKVSPLTSGGIVTLSGFISASAQDIMVQEPSQTISLKDWLQEQDIVLHLKH